MILKGKRFDFLVDVTSDEVLCVQEVLSIFQSILTKLNGQETKSVPWFHAKLYIAFFLKREADI